ncbi:putative PPE family protein PPE24 [Toxocara canis]|uniref:Putative PPE family protein PPE24 n=1 Tax=Toxocara canis TaxID=6265 RepID=A0A0B2VQU6_TOXCA|nr:putative PPE family protein PPE24 [Toxocara canis]
MSAVECISTVPDSGSPHSDAREMASSVEQKFSTEIEPSTYKCALIITSLITPSLVMPALIIPSVIMPAIPSVIMPVLIIPSVIIPALIIPSLIIPSLVIPALIIPSVIIPAIPSVIMPVLIIPSVIIPALIIPSLIIPSLVIPALIIPSLVIPALIIPSLVIPALIIPSLVIPALIIPSAIIPALIISSEGRTALHYASVIPDSDVRKSLTTLLINAGANKHLTDSKGHSPSSYSRDNRQAQSLYRAVRTKTLDMIDEDEENIDTDVEERILNLNFESTSFNELENIQIEGKSDQIWRVIKKHIGNEKLVRYVNRFRMLQNRLNSAIIAVEENDIRKLKNLVNTELILSRDSRGLSLLHIAVCKERHEIVEYLATEFPNSVDITDEVGRSPVHYAATQQNAIYDTLVEFGADPTRPDNDGWTAARYRSYPDRFVRPVSQLTHISPPIISRLSLDENIFDPGAPSEEDVERWLAEGDVQKLEQVMLDGRVHLLIDKKTVNLASDEFLRGVPQYQAKIDAIHKAVEDGDVRRVKSLIDRPQLATARDRYGPSTNSSLAIGLTGRMTPLHKALLHGQTNTVRYLLAKYPSCVNAADHAGRTALHYAAADSNGEHMIKVLQKAGGDAFIEDKHGHTPFYYRSHGRHLNVRTLKDNAVMNQLISGQLNRPLLQDLEEDISDWIHTGNVGKLEELVLNGYADLLLGRTHEIEDHDAITFLEVLPQYQVEDLDDWALFRTVLNNGVACIKRVDKLLTTACYDNLLDQIVIGEIPYLHIQWLRKEV